MKKITLYDYNQTVLFMHMFDVLISEKAVVQNVKKEALLKDLDINPSSFRRSRNDEKNVGKVIISKLSKYFGLKMIDHDYLQFLSKIINDIYLDVNYRIDSKFDFYLEKLNELSIEKTIMFPVVDLFVLFLNVFAFTDLETMIEKHRESFKNLSKYQLFFNNDLLSIYKMLELVFCKKLTSDLIFKCSDGISYSIIANRFCLEGNYVESVNYSRKAKEIFIQENNLKRILQINFTMLNNLAHTHNFYSYYSLAEEQLFTLRSLGGNSIEYKNAIKHFVVSATALKKFDEVISVLEDQSELTLTELFAFIVAKHNLDNDEFAIWYEKNVLNNDCLKEHYNDIDALRCYLETNSKKYLSKLNENKIVMDSFIEVMKLA